MKNKPPETPFAQRTSTTYFSSMHPYWTGMALCVIGIVFVPVGQYLTDQAASIFERRVTYDDSLNGGAPCDITSANQGLQCQVSYSVKQ